MSDMGFSDQELIARLRSQAETVSKISREIAEAKSLRQSDNPEGRTDLYEWPAPEQTLEGQAADRLAAHRIETNTRTGDTARCPLQGCVILQPHTHDPADRSKITLAALSSPQSITPPELVERLLTLIEVRQMAGIVEDGERVGAAARRFHHASLAVAEFIGANWPTIIAALSTPDTKALVESLEYYADQFCELGTSHEACGKLSREECSGCDAREALAQHRGSTHG